MEHTNLSDNNTTEVMDGIKETVTSARIVSFVFT